MTAFLEKQAVIAQDHTVFCPLRFGYVSVQRCLDCSRLVRADENNPPRFIVCDARMLDRRETRAR